LQNYTVPNGHDLPAAAAGLLLPVDMLRGRYSGLKFMQYRAGPLISTRPRTTQAADERKELRRR
jgi:hypothetical protein